MGRVVASAGGYGSTTGGLAAGDRRQRSPSRSTARTLELERPFEDVSDPLETGAPTREDIRAIIEFLRPHAGERVLVHCEYGQSRSTAVALGAACMYGWNPVVAARDLSKLVVPAGAFYLNLLVLEHFDDELNLGGELVRVGSTWTLG